ncbi:MAG TPA: helix-turn-helix transcriptional regulator [Blastocatellia bacterium]|nr:helix-turn-helix transcriptional regulator [Blastocatellia bacterium]
MAVKLRIKEVAEKLGIKNAAQLREFTGLGMGTCYQLWDNKAQGIQLDTLNTLCNKLQVGPAMLFEYTPDVEAHKSGPAGSNESMRRQRRGSAQKSKREVKAQAANVALAGV